MENPASWTEVELTIAQALKTHEQAQAAGIVGGSREMVIATALRNAGLIAENASDEPIGWDRLREALGN